MSKLNWTEGALLTVPQVAQLLALSKSTVYGLMAKGELPFHKIGRSRRVSQVDLARLAERSRHEYRS